MMTLHFVPNFMPHFTTAVQIGAALPIGVLLGVAYFKSLHWTVQLIGAGRGYGYVKAFATQGLRFLLLAAAFVMLAKIGAAALLSATIGLLLARQAVLHFARSRP